MFKEEEKDEMVKDGNKKVRKGKYGKMENIEIIVDVF